MQNAHAVSKRLIFYFSILVVFLFSYPIIYYPLGRDHAISAYIGKSINEGGLPFVDGWEQKPPLVYYWYSLAFVLFGESMEGLRLFDLLHTFCTILVLYRLGTFLFGISTGMLSGILYAALYLFTNDFWTISNTDGLLVLPTALSLYTCCLAQEKNRKVLFFLSGVFMGCVFLIKFPGILIALPLSLYMLIDGLVNKGRSIKRFWYNLAFVISGVVLILFICIAYFIQHQAWNELFYTLFVFNPLYAKGAFGVQERMYLDLSLAGFCKKNVLATLPALYAVSGIRMRGFDLKLSLIVGWLIISLTGVYMQYRFFLYHWLPVLGPLAMLGAYGMWRIFSQPFFTKKSALLFRIKNPILLITLIPLALVTFKPYFRQSLDFLKYKRGFMTRFDYYNTYFGRYNEGDFSFLADEEVSAYIRSHTSSDDYIFIWGFGTLVYFLADRTSASRFVFPNALLSAWHPRHAEWRRQLIHDLTARKPRYIIVVEKDSVSWVTGTEGDSLQNLKNFPALNNLINNEYSLEKTIEHFHLYRIKSQV